MIYSSHLIPFLLFISALQCITLQVNMAPWVHSRNLAGDWRFDCRYSKGRPIYRQGSAKTYMFNSNGWLWYVGGVPELNNGWLAMHSSQYLQSTATISSITIPRADGRGSLLYTSTSRVLKEAYSNHSIYMKKYESASLKMHDEVKLLRSIYCHTQKRFRINHQ